MRNSVELQMNQPLRYPSNDGSMNWPSMLSSFNSQNSQSIRKVSNLLNFFHNFSDFESDNEHIPKKLQKLDEMRIQYLSDQIQTNKIFFRTFFITQIGLSILQKTYLLTLSLLLPYLQFSRKSQDSKQFENINKIYNQIILIVLILEFAHLGVILILKKQQQKTIPLISMVRKLLILIIYILISTTDNIYLESLLPLTLFIRSFKLIKNILRTFFFNYYFIKIMLIVLYNLHYFACMLGSLDEFQYSSYGECFFYSFKLMTQQIDEISDISKREIEFLSFIITFILILYVLAQIQTQENLKQQKQEALNQYRLYIYSSKVNFPSRLILFAKSRYFFLHGKSKKNHLESILSYIKFEIVCTFMRQFKFFTQYDLELISKVGELRSYLRNLENENFEANIDGIYLFMNGKLMIEFYGLNLDLTENQLTKIQILESIGSNFQKQIKILNLNQENFLYFYISQEGFRSCFSDQLQKERFHLLKDEICLYEGTSNLQIECIFCNKYHPSFVCQSFNLKKRYQYNKTYQHRQTIYVRKNQKRSRAGIYEQATIQGSSRHEVIELSSDSFEPFSDYSIEQSHNDIMLNSMVQCSELKLKSTSLLLHRDTIHTELLHEQILESLQINQQNSKNHSHKTIPNKFENIPPERLHDFDSIFEIEIDKYFEYSTYNTNYNLSNVLKSLNQTNHKF